MATITGLYDIKGKKTRKGLELDGQPAGSLHRATVAETGLQVGMELYPEDLEALYMGSELKLAKEAALYYLGRQARSRMELIRYLTSKGYARQTAEAACEIIEGYGYLDDAALSRSIVQNTAAGGKGRRSAAEKLRQKGISREIAEAELADYSPEEEAEACMSAAEGLWRRYSREEPRKRREKTAQALLCRGFGWDTIEPAIRRMEEEE